MKRLVLLLTLLAFPAIAQPLHGPIYIPMRLAPDGTLYIEVGFGTTSVRCLIDSGATTVAVPPETLGLITLGTSVMPFGTFTYTMADGSVRTSPKFAVDNVSFTAPNAHGVTYRVSFNHVPVVVIPDGECLIGQTLLQRFDTVAFNYTRNAFEVWWRQ